MLLTVKNKDYTIPEKWNQIGLGMYQEFMSKTKDVTDTTILDKIAISSFTGLSINLIDKIRKQDIDAVKTELNKLLNVKMNTTLNTIIEIDGIDFGFHPKLKDLTFGEFVDLDNYLSEPWENMHYIMAILYRPITSTKKKKYSIEEYDSDKSFDRANLFKDNLSVATVNGAASFFLTIGKEYQIALQSSLSKQQKEMMKKTELQTQTTSIQSGVGTE
jgi:hypothetical protein|tara:strand:+ start:6687 stop:7337 length:651 start_codon:yes stop_codon:yes gene_type:complete